MSSLHFGVSNSGRDSRLGPSVPKSGVEDPLLTLTNFLSSGTTNLCVFFT